MIQIVKVTLPVRIAEKEAILVLPEQTVAAEVAIQDWAHVSNDVF